jgi:hypothetical protein
MSICILMGFDGCHKPAKKEKEKEKEKEKRKEKERDDNYDDLMIIDRWRVYIKGEQVAYFFWGFLC